MKAVASAALALLLVSTPIAQQVGSVDLTRPPAGTREKRDLPNGCEKLSGGGIADGWVEPEDHRPRDLVVEVINVSDWKPAVGRELQAEVRLRNIDARSIQIPWSTDPNVIEDGQDPANLQWDVGTFEFTLRDPQDNQIALKSLTGWLYGSKFSAGSQLTVHAGESIVALVKFKLEDKYPIEPGRPNEGEWQLLAEWHQVGRSWYVKNCEPWNAYFQYEHYYEQRNPAVAIQVTRAGSTANNEASK